MNAFQTHGRQTHGRGETRRFGPRRRSLAIVGVSIAALVAVVTAATARGGGFEEGEHVEGLFYGDFAEELLLFAGATPEDFCNENEPIHEARVFNRADGRVEIKVDNSAQPVYLYASSLGAPELIDETCAALFDEDPLTGPQAPIAEGEGRVRIRLDIAPDGDVHVVNQTVGDATAPDGTVWKVRGWADLMVVDGAPVGDPAEFQGLRATRTKANAGD